MRIRNKLFPYPILNKDESLSDYKDTTTFELHFDIDENMLDKNKNVVFNKVRLVTNSDLMRELMRGGKAKAVLIIECSNTIYREKFEIGFKPQDFSIPVGQLNGQIEISAFVYATEDLILDEKNTFAADYDGYSFNVEKYCILAADDSLSMNIENQPENDNQVTSIFTIVGRREETQDIMKYSLGDRKILIHLPQKQYNNYNAIKGSEKLRNASFAIIAIPILTEVISDIQKTLQGDDEYSLDDMRERYRWFRSIMNAYKRVSGKDLERVTIINELKPLEVAQMVLNDGTCKGIQDLNDLAIGREDESGENDDDE